MKLFGNLKLSIHLDQLIVQVHLFSKSIHHLQQAHVKSIQQMELQILYFMLLVSIGKLMRLSKIIHCTQYPNRSSHFHQYHHLEFDYLLVRISISLLIFVIHSIVLLNFISHLLLSFNNHLSRINFNCLRVKIKIQFVN